MIAITRFLAAAMLALAIALGAPAQAQTEVRNAPDPYVHAGTGVRFPAAAGNFRRGRVIHYEDNGYDASVGYAIEGRPGEMTLYVYPDSGDTCRGWFNGADDAVLRRGGFTRLADAAPFKLFAGSGIEQYTARYDAAEGALGEGVPAVVSYLWVGCRKDTAGNGWVMKYRGSFFKEDAPKIEELTRQLFAVIDWSPLLGE